MNNKAHLVVSYQTNTSLTIATRSVPEPTSFALLSIGTLGMAEKRRRVRQRA